MTLEVQFFSMLASAGTGIWLGASFDTYKRFLGSPRRFRWTFVINDILFWLIQGLIFFYILLQVNNGEVRLFLILALLLGYSIYRALLENLFQKLLEWGISFCKGAYRIIYRTILVLVIEPIKWLLQLTIGLSMILLTTLWKILYSLLKIIFFPFRKIGRVLRDFFMKQLRFLKKRVDYWIHKMKTKWKNWFK